MPSTLSRRQLLGAAGASTVALALTSRAATRVPQPAGGPLDGVRARLADPSQPFTLLVRFTLRPGAYESFRPLLDSAIAGTAREAGVVQYEFHRSLAEPDSFVLIEQWRSFPDLERHFEGDYTSSLVRALGGLTTAPPALDVYQRVGAPAVPARPVLAGFYRFRIGDIPCVAVSDGYLEFAPLHPTWGPNLTPEELESLLRPFHVSTARATIEVSCLVLELGSELVLVDTGAGTLFGPSTGHLLTNLRAAGIDPRAITAVALTHAHPDHVGGLLDHLGNPAFPNARVFLTAVEHRFWTGPAPDLSAVSVPDDIKAGWVRGAQSRLAPYASRLEPVKGGDRVLGSLQFLDTPGHTPGHAAIRVGNGPDSLLVTGDVIGHHVLGTERVDAATIFDTDRAGAIASRRALLERAAADGTRLFSYHASWPGLARVRPRAGNTGGYEWMHEAMQW